MSYFLIEKIGFQARKTSRFPDYNKIRLVSLFIDRQYVNGIPEILLERINDAKDYKQWVSKVCPIIKLYKNVIYAVVDEKKNGIDNYFWSMAIENYYKEHEMIMVVPNEYKDCLLWASGSVKK